MAPRMFPPWLDTLAMALHCLEKPEGQERFIVQRNPEVNEVSNVMFLLFVVGGYFHGIFFLVNGYHIHHKKCFLKPFFNPFILKRTFFFTGLLNIST